MERFILGISLGQHILDILDLKILKIKASI